MEVALVKSMLEDLLLVLELERVGDNAIHLQRLMLTLVATVIAPVYIAEIAPRSIRGLCTCVFAGAVYIGIMVGTPPPDDVLNH